MVDIDVELSGMETTREELRDIETDYVEEDGVVYIVGPSVEYAVWVEFGRGPVEAQEAEALRFEVDNEVIFRQRVGPAEPQPFMRPAARYIERNARRIAAGQDSLKATVKALAFELERVAKQEAPVETGTLRASIAAREIP